MIINAIDIGKNGCLCSITMKENVIEHIAFSDYTSPSDYYNVLKSQIDKNPNEEIFYVIEKVYAYSNQGSKSGFTFGERNGEINAILSILNKQAVYIHPRIWQDSLGIKTKDKKERKNQIANYIINMIPSAQNELYGSRGGLKDGRSDSLAIGLYFIKKLLKN